ncbi:DNA topoisomerase IB [Roseobacter sp. HKCCA0434]|uniref:DNA topoisomerase IB n=1 Tax=Roseobacter sp. HKCCA0434 TaxID=3079297 RepID=UPI002905AC06|nr:DNA topoisomerase IB [Roseobacter sp. HKCCA0434]
MRLRHVNDSEPGLSRRRAGRGFAYYDEGTLVRDPAVKARIASLAIPPAYDDVWICRTADGHLQATGRDVKGRKQYRYHPDWHAAQTEQKFSELVAFSRMLPDLRAHVAQEMRRRNLGRDRVLATVVYLLERAHIRIGNEAYTRENGSFGLTTLRPEHVQANGRSVRFRFKGKSGQLRDFKLDDGRVTGLVRKLSDLPGQDLFQWEDEDGVHDVKSEHVNAWLQEVTGAELTAKIFRTWAGTVLCADRLARGAESVLEGVDHAAEALGNTRAVARSSYIHPAVIDAFEAGRWPGRRKLDGPPLGDGALSATEKAVVRLIA